MRDADPARDRRRDAERRRSSRTTSAPPSSSRHASTCGHYLATKRAAMRGRTRARSTTDSFFLRCPRRSFARRVRHRVVHPPGRTRRHPGDLAVPVSASHGWVLFAVGLVTLGLAINVLRPSRSFFGMAISFFAEWLVSELAHWTILVLGATVALLASFGGLDHTMGGSDSTAACVGLPPARRRAVARVAHRPTVIRRSTKPDWARPIRPRPHAATAVPLLPRRPTGSPSRRRALRRRRGTPSPRRRVRAARGIGTRRCCCRSTAARG